MPDSVVFWLSCGGYLLLLGYILIAYTGVLFHSKRASRRRLESVYPARWNFFTQKKLSDKVYKLYNVQGGRAVYFDNSRFSTQYCFGLNRDSYLIVAETQYIGEAKNGEQCRKYQLVLPEGGDINLYLRIDTLQFCSYSSREVNYLKGRYLVTIEDPRTWDEIKNSAKTERNIVVMPVNITTGK